MITHNCSVPDHYSEWLGIPPGPRPPDYYTLLGLDLDTTDETAINRAAKVRLTEVRKRALKFPEEASQVLNEIASAQVCLRDSLSREKYKLSLLLLSTKPEPENEPAPTRPLPPPKPKPKLPPIPTRPKKIPGQPPSQLESVDQGLGKTGIGVLLGLVAFVILAAVVIGFQDGRQRAADSGGVRIDRQGDVKTGGGRPR